MKPTFALFLAVLVVEASAQSGMLHPPTAAAYVTVPNAPALTPQTGLTVESWFYFDPSLPTSPSWPTIVRKDPGTTPYILRATGPNGGNPQLVIWTQGQNYTNLYGSVPLPVLSWHHMAGTYDGVMMRIYLDGVLVGSTPKTGPLINTTGPLIMCQGQSGGGEEWKGDVDEIRIWSVARSAAEIQSTMFYRIDNVPNLVAAWHFDGNFQDLTGGHTGTPVGGATIVPSTSPVLSVYLQAPQLSPIGSPLHFALTAFPAPAPYILEISVTGTSPGTAIPPPGTGVFPLNQPFLHEQLGGMFPNTFQNFTGLTDGAGHATATLNVWPDPILAGLVVSAAFVVIDGTAPYGIGKISNATQTTISGFAPTIAAVSPQTGPVTGGWTVTITGANFQTGAQVRFDGVAATNVSVSPGSITCFTPPGSLGPADVEVQNPDGNVVVAQGAFSYVTALSLSGTNPIVAAPGTPMVVTGAGFTPGLAATMSGTPVPVSNVTPGSFTATMPAAPQCDAPLIVTLPDMQTAVMTINPVPVVNAVVGPPGVPSGGSTFFVFGSAFHPGTVVTIGGANAPIQSMSTTVIVATAPPGASGPALLAVSSAAGCSDTTFYTYQ